MDNDLAGIDIVHHKFLDNDLAGIKLLDNDLAGIDKVVKLKCIDQNGKKSKYRD